MITIERCLDYKLGRVPCKVWGSVATHVVAHHQWDFVYMVLITASDWFKRSTLSTNKLTQDRNRDTALSNQIIKCTIFYNLQVVTWWTTRSRATLQWPMMIRPVLHWVGATGHYTRVTTHVKHLFSLTTNPHKPSQTLTNQHKPSKTLTNHHRTSQTLKNPHNPHKPTQSITNLYKPMQTLTIHHNPHKPSQTYTHPHINCYILQVPQPLLHAALVTPYVSSGVALLHVMLLMQANVPSMVFVSKGKE